MTWDSGCIYHSGLQNIPAKPTSCYYRLFFAGALGSRVVQGLWWGD